MVIVEGGMEGRGGGGLGAREGEGEGKKKRKEKGVEEERRSGFPDIRGLQRSTEEKRSAPRVRLSLGRCQRHIPRQMAHIHRPDHF